MQHTLISPADALASAISENDVAIVAQASRFPRRREDGSGSELDIEIEIAGRDGQSLMDLYGMTCTAEGEVLLKPDGTVTVTTCCVALSAEPVSDAPTETTTSLLHATVRALLVATGEQQHPDAFATDWSAPEARWPSELPVPGWRETLAGRRSTDWAALDAERERNWLTS